MFKKSLSILILAGVFQVANASEQTGVISNIRVSSQSFTPGSPTHVKITGTWLNKPLCAIDWWAINTDTEAGKSLLSIILTAHSTGKTVTIWGTGLCDLNSGMETMFQVGL